MTRRALSARPGDGAADGMPGHPGARRAAWVAAAVVFAAAPWATLGFGTPVAFILAAALFSFMHRAHATILWISAAVYAAALAVVISASDAPNPPGAIIACFLFIAVLGGGLQALVTIGIVARGHDPGLRDTLHAIRHHRHRVRAQRRSRPPGNRGMRPPGHHRGGRSRGNRGMRALVPQMRHPRLTASVIAVLAAASITAGIALLADGYHFAAHHQATVGVVTASAEDVMCNTGGCTTDYDTTIRYRPPGSRTMVHKEGWGEYLAPGTHIPIYYDPRNPGDASLWPDKRERFEGIFWIAAGLVVFLCLGCGVIIYRKNQAGTLAGSSHPGGSPPA